MAPVQRWDFPAGTLRDVRSIKSAVHAIASSRDGKLLALASGNAVYLRDAATGRLRGCVNPHTAGSDAWGRLVHIALSPDGALLAMGFALGKNSEVLVWDVKEGREVGAVTASVEAMAFSPDGKTLAAARFSPSCVTLYNPRDLKESRQVARQKSGVKAVAFSPDGKTVATSNDRGAVQLWDLAEDKQLWSKGWSQANAWRQSICFSPDGKYLVAAPLSSKQGLVLVDVADGKLRTELARYPMPNSDPCFSPDGKYLAVVLKSPGQVVVFEVEKLLTTKP